MTTAFTPQAKSHEGLGPLDSRVVHVNEMAWTPIRYPGCYVKTLLVDPKQGLSVGPGEFVWRPAGSRHAAWTPEGAVMVAVFQVPNKFFEANGAVVDLVGDDWAKKWGHVVA